MKGKLKCWIIAIVVIIILMIPIIVEFVNNKNVKVLSYTEFNDLVSKGEFAVVYFGDVSSESFTAEKEKLINIRSKYDVEVRAVDSKKLTEEESSALVKTSEAYKAEKVYSFINGGSTAFVAGEALTEEKIGTYVDKIHNNIIPEDEIAYKTVKTYKEYMDLVDSKDVIMAVFGRNSCSWCNKFKPVYNDAAASYKFGVYYFDSDSFDSTEYNKIMNSKIKIPASCSSTGEAQSLSEGFGTPLTIFTKKGKVIDCISGYTDKAGLDAKLKKIGIIK